MVARQAIVVSIKELEDKAKELRKEARESSIPLGEEQTWLIPIINKTPKSSDTWKFEV